jgi:hypothetical protein
VEASKYLAWHHLKPSGLSRRPSTASTALFQDHGGAGPKTPVSNCPISQNQATRFAQLTTRPCDRLRPQSTSSHRIPNTARQARLHADHSPVSMPVLASSDSPRSAPSSQGLKRHESKTPMRAWRTPRGGAQCSLTGEPCAARVGWPGLEWRPLATAPTTCGLAFCSALSFVVNNARAESTRPFARRVHRR